MKPWWLLVAGAAIFAFGRGGSGVDLPAGPQVPHGPAPPADLHTPAIWSLGADWAPRCDGQLRVVPTATSGWGTQVRQGMTAPLMWGWTGPGQHAAADKYAGRLIADVESAVTAQGVAKWTGGELGSAAYLAERCPAVTSHGFVAPKIRKVLQVFAGAGCVGVPQVYDTDRSTLGRPGGPRKFLRDCVDSYAAAGFARVLPLLGLSAGLDIVAEWIDECSKMGVPFHLYSLQRLTPQACALVQPWL